MVKLLLKAGAQKHQETSRGRTALEIAQAGWSEEHHQIVKILEGNKILGDQSWLPIPGFSRSF